MKERLIEVQNLSKFFIHSKNPLEKQYALKQVNLDIYQGDIYGIIGTSGAGKSTLMRCLTALEQPNEGTIRIRGNDITHKTEKELSDFRREMGMIFQHFHLFSSRTVAENIAYPLEIQGIPKNQQIHRIHELLSLVNLEQKYDHYPSQLSGGERQRVGIARALANQPQFLFCDEPTSALDLKTAQSILQLLWQLNQQLGLTIVLITHQLEAIKQVCNQVAVLANGEVVEKGEIKRVFTQPNHPFTKHLLHLDHIHSDLFIQRNPTKKLVRLSFEGDQAKKPIISLMVKKYDIEANILSGKIDYLRDTSIGNLIVELSGPDTELHQALDFLYHQQINCEILT